jgi:hypothetical protein
VPRRRGPAILSIYPGAKLGRRAYGSGSRPELSDGEDSKFVTPAPADKQKGLAHERTSKTEVAVDKSANNMSKNTLQMPDCQPSTMTSKARLSLPGDDSMRSLNAYKKECDRRIENENLKLARKIFEIRPSIRASNLEREWRASKTIEKRLRQIKVKRLNANTDLVLPPIKDAEQLPEFMS